MIYFAATLAQQFEWLWFVWIVMFVVLELTALWLGRKRTDDHSWQGGTLSELVWRTFKRQRWAFCILVVFLGVLGVHFLFAI